MPLSISWIAALVLLNGLILSGAAPSPPPSLRTSSLGCESSSLLWSDEFNGGAIDTSSWNFWEGPAFNNELQYYTKRTKNARLENGSLVLEAYREDYSGKGYTSGRIDTRLKRAFYPGMTYGGKVYSKIRFEARIRVPKGQGMWPAFWLLPSRATCADCPSGQTVCDACGPYGNWPYSGEIDILEAINDMSTLFSTIHYGYSESGGTLNNQGVYKPVASKIGLQWHTYAFEWSATQMWFELDGVTYFTTHSHSVSEGGWFTTSQTAVPNGPNSPFDAPFYIILNLAVGGDWPGPPDGITTFPAQMYVDYVRVSGYPAS